ncbi:hypothetical protein ACQPXH_13975 [Nocardia sp. CA-135953]
MVEVFLVDGARTPQGRYGGALAGGTDDKHARMTAFLEKKA